MSNFAQKIRSGCCLFCCILWILVLLQPYRVYGSFAAEEFIDNGGYIVHDDSGVLKFREQDLFIPASTLKVLTCLVALENLGREYRFETHFFLDNKNNLYIKGYGDPFLTSEVIFGIGKKLAEMGVQQLGTLFLDESNFALNRVTAGDEISANPYDVPNGALVVNFNSLPLQVAGDTAINSGEPQTPFIPLMAEAAAGLSPGRHRINIETLSTDGQLTPSLRYAGELFIVLFRQAGIRVQNGYDTRTVPENLDPIYIHHCEKSLEEIVKACLKNSNNYIANQLFLACGVKSYGLPATWNKSRQAFADFTKKILHLSPSEIIVAEGSGLSRQNRMSPAALITILELFRPYSGLLKQQNNVLLKSGTMKGIYCYAGYFPQGDNLIPFAILLNQPKNNRSRVLEILHSALGSARAS